MRRRLASLQARLLVGLGLLVGVVGGATALLAGHWARHELDELLDAHLAQAAAVLVVQQGGPLAHDDTRVMDAPSLHRYAPRAVWQVFHESRLALRSSEAPTTALVPDQAEGFHTVTRDGARWRVFVTHGRDSDVTVLVGERDTARRDILQAVLGPLLALAGAALLLLLGLNAAVLHWGLAPLRGLSRQLADRRPDPLAPLDLPDAPTELRPVLSALNALFARIEALLQSERRLTADAAHELRTPIAAIRAQAQVALVAHADAERAHALAATLTGCDRAARLVDQLLMLARLEAADTTPRNPLDLTPLARQAVVHAAEGPLHHGHVLTLEAPAAVPALGDPVLVEVLLRNLLDNAQRYSPPGSPVTLSLQATATGWQLDLDDGGPGLDAAGLARLGQRFQRGADTVAPGSGLGWSIVRRIAALLGWTVVADRSVRHGGLHVRIAPDGD